MRIAIIGATGQLGSDLTRVLQAEHEVIALTHADVEVTDVGSLAAMLAQHRPELVMSMAAFHKVDLCEEQIERAFSINAYGARNLALVCRAHEAALLYVSSDYVFGAERARRLPYFESDCPAPINVYGVSKMAGEAFVRDLCERHYVLRVTGLYGIAGPSGKGSNFVELMLRLAREGKPIRVVDDQCMTPTYTLALARQIAALIRTEQYGLFHMTCQGQCTWYEFAQEIFRQSGLTPDLQRARTGDFGERATRPAYSVLENEALKYLALDQMPDWRDALAAYLNERRGEGHSA